MEKDIKFYVGLDVHKDTIVMAVSTVRLSSAEFDARGRLAYRLGPNDRMTGGSVICGSLVGPRYRCL